MTPPVNQFHEALRRLCLEDAITVIRVEITKRGYDVVKNDPGVYAWVMENRAALAPLANKGGLSGASRH